LTTVFLWWGWGQRNRRAIPGVDRVTARQYGENLPANLEGVAAAVQGGWYRAKLVLRKYIPKLNGKMRPLGIPSVADKVLQMAVKRILEAIYEADFLGCSYGYRPGRGAHDAIRELTAKLGKGP
jgi:RNA-directed DNA polymerase